jgi:hypothetical protein
VSLIADNIAITPGSGASVATEDVAGIQHQKVKMEFGGDGVATLVSSVDPLPVSAPAAARTTHSIAVVQQTDALMNGLTEMTPKYTSATVAASQTDASLIAAVGGKILRVVALSVQCGATATTSTFESGTTTRIHKVPAGANGGQILPFNPLGWFSTGSGLALTVTTGAGSDTEYTIVYVEV